MIFPTVALKGYAFQVFEKSDGAVLSAGAAHHVHPASVGSKKKRQPRSLRFYTSLRRPPLDRECNMLECVFPVRAHQQRPGRVTHTSERQGSYGNESVHVDGIVAQRVALDPRPGAAGVGRQTEEAPEVGVR